MFLSGGVDSSAIAALIRKLTGGPLKTFSVGYEEQQYSELTYAAQVAGSIGTDHNEIVVSMDDFFSALPRLIWHEDEPIVWPSSVSLYFVSQLAARQVKVVLTGEGADELFAGYSRYQLYLLNRRFSAPYRVLPQGLRNGIRQWVQSSSLLTGAARRKLGHSFAGRADSFESLYLDNSFSAFSADQQSGLLLQPGGAAYASWLSYWNAAAGRPLLDRLLYTDQKTYLVELLMKQDQMSMAASIESRVPFLDHPLVEYATRLPEHMKVRGLETKVVLRRAMTGLLPEAILTRPKMGFPVPVGAWLRGPYRPLLDELVTGPRAAARGLVDAAAVKQLVAEHLAGRANHDQRLWLLLNLELWHRVFIDKEPIEATLGSAMRAAA
jgi:asparagine synthase (glutamine-hydrolysing)